MSEASAPVLSLRTALAMLAFTLVFTALMAGAYQLTREPIARSAAAEQLRLIDAILPRASYDNALLRDTTMLHAPAALGLAQAQLWRARRGGKLVAWVVEAAAPDGYSGEIRLILALSLDGKLLGVRVTQHRETPGLGDYIDPRKDRNKARPWISQFAGRDTRADATRWTVRKDGGDFDAMSGATISARAVSQAVGRAVNYLVAHQAELAAAPALPGDPQ